MAITIISTTNTMNGDGTIKEVLVQFGGTNLAHVDYISGTVKADNKFLNLSTDEQQKVVLDKIKAEFWPEPFNEDKIDAISGTVEQFTETVGNKVANVETKVIAVEETVSGVTKEVVDAGKAIDKTNANAVALANAVNRVAKQVLKSSIPEAEYAELIEIFPEWQTETSYENGEVVRYAGKAWEVIQTHTSQSDWTPETVPALFKEVTPKTVVDEETGEKVELIPDFVKPTGGHDAYNIGDKVNFEGSTYESTMDANTYTPAEYPQGWNKI